MRRNDVASTSFRRRVPTRFLINQCQIITFLILKYDIIENLRIELRGIVLPVQVGGLLGGGGGQRVCCPPPLKLLEGLAPLAPPPLFLRLCFEQYTSKLLHTVWSSLMIYISGQKSQGRLSVQILMWMDTFSFFSLFGIPIQRVPLRAVFFCHFYNWKELKRLNLCFSGWRSPSKKGYIL